MMHVKNKRRTRLAGSLKKRMPMMTAPVAPSPVQMAYAVPNGMSRIANAKKRKPPEKERTSASSQRIRFVFKNTLMLATPNTSPRLATTKYNQANYDPSFRAIGRFASVSDPLDVN